MTIEWRMPAADNINWLCIQHNDRMYMYSDGIYTRRYDPDMWYFIPHDSEYSWICDTVAYISFTVGLYRFENWRIQNVRVIPSLNLLKMLSDNPSWQ